MTINEPYKVLAVGNKKDLSFYFLLVKMKGDQRYAVLAVDRRDKEATYCLNTEKDSVIQDRWSKEMKWFSSSGALLHALEGYEDRDDPNLNQLYDKAKGIFL